MINCSVCLFGRFGNGYTQYPDDYARDIYKQFQEKAKAKSQIVIHRKNNLMYYGYIRKLDNSLQYIGICVLLNGVMFKQIDNLFTIFENAFADLVSRGNIIGFNDKGNIVSYVLDLKEKQDEIDKIATFVKRQLSIMENCTASLPPVSFGISKFESKSFDMSSKQEDIIEASAKYPYTCISKNKGYNNASLSGYKGVIRKLHKEKEALSAKCSQLEKDYAKLNKQKKQFKLVVIGLIAVIACSIGLFFMNQELNTTKDNLQEARNDIHKKGNKIKNLNAQVSDQKTQIGNLEYSLKEEQNQRKEAEEKLSSLKSTLENKQPFVVTSNSFNFNTGWFKFDYYGFTDKTITLSIRAFNGSYSYSNSTTMSIERGAHSFSIYLSPYLNSSKWYSFELLIGNKIIGGGRM